MRASVNRARQSGISMIEVLVTLIILLVGLLGLAGLMAQSQRSELGSYQRVQALVLLQDMVGRINTNRAIAATTPYCYAFTTNATQGTPYVGNTGAGVLTVSPAPNCTVGTAGQVTQFQQDLQAWNNELLGATETFTDPVTGVTTNSGAMVNARGCVSYDSTTELHDYTSGAAIAGSGLYTVAVAWQGEGDSFAPPASTIPAMNCAYGLYGPETRRRIVAMSFRIGAINNTL
jgi:type IV pilus assembly protein PilV